MQRPKYSPLQFACRALNRHDSTSRVRQFAGGLLGPKGLWGLCAAGKLTVDQVTTEIHLRKASSLGAVNAIFEGAARCGLVLLRTETNWVGCHFGGCMEASWASLRHVRRVLEHRRRKTQAA